MLKLKHNSEAQYWELFDKDNKLIPNFIGVDTDLKFYIIYEELDENNKPKTLKPKRVYESFSIKDKRNSNDAIVISR